VWTGKGSTKEERKESMHIAQKFIADQGRPSYTPVERNVESGESAMFKSYFFQVNGLGSSVYFFLVFKKGPSKE
jgi:hypothetical protein